MPTKPPPKTHDAFYQDRLHVFAKIMRERFPAADFKVMLENANLESILSCLKSTPIAVLTGHDIEKFRGLLEQLANMPQSSDRPQTDKPKPGRLDGRRDRSRINETGLMLFGRHLIAARTQPTGKQRRPRARNILKLDRSPVCRQASQSDN